MDTFEFALDKTSAVPLYRQIGEAVLSLIENGAIAPDTKLPTIRRFAESLNVNAVTIVNAYRYLENRRAVYSITGSGIYAADLGVSETAVGPAILTREKKDNPEATIDFSKASISNELFPVREFKSLFNEVLDRDKGDAFEYEEIRGYRPLREAFCEYMARFGLKPLADRVHVISGAQQGIDIASKTLLKTGDAVIIESPTYLGAMASFYSRGASVYEIPMRSGGVDIETLTALVRKFKPKLFYCMPYFQTPTCYSYSLENKRALLELAYKYNFYILEEDNQSDFNYREEAIVPIKALDYRNKVIYLKSFSKLLMPGLRIGFMLLPKSISQAALAAKQTSDIDTSGFLQRAFHLFLEKGMFYEHAKKMRNIFEIRYNHTLNALNRNLKGLLGYSEPGGGLNFWLSLPPGKESFFDKLSAAGVSVSEGSMFSFEQNLPFFRISFADIAPADIDAGIEIIGRCL